MGNLILKVALSYLEKHPEQVEQLIEAGVQALVAHLHKSKDAK